MVVVPTPTAVIVPYALILAMFGFKLYQLYLSLDVLSGAFSPKYTFLVNPCVRVVHPSSQLLSLTSLPQSVVLMSVRIVKI